ncbi:MAG: PP2C family serine/threonine-protein phosphatase [Trebonia sp.]|uniref:PP2C family protein-serine/threonine phosphatase n=1 Tax=Trebonia sp. TaxID=2767075 RepID=UPI003BB0098C
MTLALRYAVRSDVGLLREGNEDSAYAGPHLLAVADGMGGHAAGEVASSATITTISSLDSERPGIDLVSALAEAVAMANMRLQELVISDPATEGMGTTLTAMLWLDGHAALCHIGDSRAYLLRSGQFYQITHDHTLVQSLVDEGKITEDDVATHPHRSLLLRALDGRTIAEPDLSQLETMPGDRLLLCSDGLSGVVTEQTLHQTLSSVWDPDQAALQLVELTIKGGGPDNITVIVADVLDTQTSSIPPTLEPVLAGAASLSSATDLRSPARQSSPATRALRLARTAPQQVVPDDAPPGDWTNGFHSPAGQAQGLAATGAPGQAGQLTDEPAVGTGRHSHRARRHRLDDDDDYAPQHDGRRRWPIVTTLLVVLVLFILGGLYGGWRYIQGQYFIGVQNGNVAIFRGVNQNVAGISLSSPVQRYDNLPVAQVVPSDQAMIHQTITESSLTAAQSLVGQIQSGVTSCQQKWQELVTWNSAYQRYQQELALYKAKQTKTPPKNNSGPQPATPDITECASASAFGIPATALSAGQQQVTKPSTAPSARSTSTASPRPSQSTTKAAG